MQQTNQLAGKKIRQNRKFQIKRSIPLYFLIAVPFVWYIVFLYVPMIGLVMAFENYNPVLGFFSSPLAQPFFTNFEFLKSNVFWLYFKNTFVIGSVNTVICFIAPVILSLLFNEMRQSAFKKSLQTVSYIPYFVSVVALISILKIMMDVDKGIINKMLEAFGAERIDFMHEPNKFLFVYVLLNLWKGLGWGTIIHTAAMSAIDVQLYEVADVEGAGRLAKIWHITLPGIRPTLVIMLILALPGLVGADFETILLLMNSDNAISSEVIGTEIYRQGIENHDYSVATAMGLLMSLINLLIIFTANSISRKISETSLF